MNNYQERMVKRIQRLLARSAKLGFWRIDDAGLSFTENASTPARKKAPPTQRGRRSLPLA